MNIKPLCFLSTVGTATTQERLTPLDLTVGAVLITAERSNTGYVYIGDENVSSTHYGADLSAGDSIRMTAIDFGYEAGTQISLTDIWLDVSVSGDGVSVMYMEEV